MTSDKIYTEKANLIENAKMIMKAMIILSSSENLLLLV